MYNNFSATIPYTINEIIDQMLNIKEDRRPLELKIQQALNLLKIPSSGPHKRLLEAGYFITYNPQTISQIKFFYLHANIEPPEEIQNATEKGGLLVDGFKICSQRPINCSHLNGLVKKNVKTNNHCEEKPNEKEKIEFSSLTSFFNLEKEIKKSSLAELHIDLAKCYSNIGATFSKEGKYEYALQMHEKALQIRKKFFEEDHIDIAATLFDIGLALEKLCKFEEAVLMLKQALEIQKKNLKEDHLDIASSYFKIGLNLSNLSKCKEAEEMLTLALEIQKKQLGEHPDTALCYFEISEAIARQDKIDEALQLLKKARKIQVETLGKEHIDTAATVHNIAFFYHQKGMKLEKALQLSKQALNVNIMQLGHETTEVAIGHATIHLCNAKISKPVNQAVSEQHTKKAKKYFIKISELENWSKIQFDIQANIQQKQYKKVFTLIDNQFQALKNCPSSVLCYLLQLSFLCENKKIHKKHEILLKQAEAACIANKEEAYLNLHLNIALIYMKAKNWKASLKHSLELKKHTKNVVCKYLDLLLMEESLNFLGEKIQADILGDYLAMRIYESKGDKIMIKLGCESLLKKLALLQNKNPLIERIERFCSDKLGS